VTFISSRFGDLLAEPLRNGVYKPKEDHGRGTKVINMKELFAYDRIDDQGTDRVALTQAELERARVVPGDLLFARRSFVLEGAGKCAIIGSPAEDTTFESSMIRARLNRERALPQFMFYLFGSAVGRNAMASIATRTAVSGITGKSLQELQLPIPPLLTQRKIGAVLSAYDDLIENNNRRIKVLEEMAQRIYREWFVHFRYPGHENVPLVDSKLGPVPDGWRVYPLSELAATQYGYTESASKDAVGPQFLRGMDINKTTYIDWSTVPYCPISASDHRKYGLSRGDVVVIRMADPGKVGIVEADVDAVFASYLIRVRPIDQLIAPYFLFYFMESDRYQAFVGGASTGTTRKSLSAPLITSIQLALPPDRLQHAFVSRVTPVRDLLNQLISANANLRVTRDLMLPRLISGEVDLTDLNIAMEGAVA
jgi:type I restriction enzyme S subunit